MFCPNCGTEVSEKAIFCVKCGIGLNNATQSNNVVNQQPPQQQYQQPYQQQYQQPQQTQPKTWLVESILVTLFCCLPFGIAGIVNAANVSSRYVSGDFEGAKRASQQAGKWTKIAFWIGLAGIVIYFVMVLIFGSFTTYNIFNPYTYGY
ncbi:MAG: zinc-ribbon domain-containing protein [Bacteroidales bacterium]|nr:zinc-ribbon domain-containing protein [Bacteroidales bacterium]